MSCYRIPFFKNAPQLSSEHKCTCGAHDPKHAIQFVAHDNSHSAGKSASTRFSSCSFFPLAKCTHLNILQHNRKRNRRVFHGFIHLSSYGTHNANRYFNDNQYNKVSVSGRHTSNSLLVGIFRLKY